MVDYGSGSFHGQAGDPNQGGDGKNEFARDRIGIQVFAGGDGQKEFPNAEGGVRQKKHIANSDMQGSAQ